MTPQELEDRLEALDGAAASGGWSWTDVRFLAVLLFVGTVALAVPILVLALLVTVVIRVLEVLSSAVPL